MLILQTPRLRLRWFTAGDAGFLRALLNDPGWLRHIGDRGVRTRRQAERWIATRHTARYGELGYGFWLVERREDGAPVGMCGLVKRDTLMEIDVGYALMPAFRGQGYAREAARACLDYGHDVLGLPEIWGITDPDNAASAAVLREIGLRDHGLERLVGQERETRLFKSPRREPGDDAARIDALVARFFAALSHRSGAVAPVAALPHYFLRDATVRTADALGTVTATDLHGFIAPRAELLAGGRLREAEECETAQRTDIAGAIAQRWLRYEARGLLDGHPTSRTGTMTMQFARTSRDWKIASLMLTDDTPADDAAPSHG